VNGECVVWGSSMEEWQDRRIQCGGVAWWEDLAWRSSRVGGSDMEEWQSGRVWHGGVVGWEGLAWGSGRVGPRMRSSVGGNGMLRRST